MELTLPSVTGPHEARFRLSKSGRECLSRHCRLSTSEDKVVPLLSSERHSSSVKALLADLCPSVRSFLKLLDQILFGSEPFASGFFSCITLTGTELDPAEWDMRVSNQSEGRHLILMTHDFAHRFSLLRIPSNRSCIMTSKFCRALSAKQMAELLHQLSSHEPWHDSCFSSERCSYALLIMKYATQIWQREGNASQLVLCSKSGGYFRPTCFWIFFWIFLVRFYFNKFWFFLQAWFPEMRFEIWHLVIDPACQRLAVEDLFGVLEAIEADGSNCPDLAISLLKACGNLDSSC